jgi:hypothetical protein
MTNNADVFNCITIASLLRYSSFHQENWKPRYNWNIFEIGIKLHNP